MNQLFDTTPYSRRGNYSDWQIDTQEIELGSKNQNLDPKHLGSKCKNLDPKHLGSKNEQLDPKQLARLVQDWDTSQLEEAIAILAALQEAKLPPVEQQKGSIELKMIKGCGPYKYLRYYTGGKKRSVYLGKAS